MRGYLLAVVGVGFVVGSASAVRGQAARDAVVAVDPGYATGHVTCADTQRPARVAQVRFVPAPRQSLVVQTDVEGVLAAVPDAKNSNPAATAQASQ